MAIARRLSIALFAAYLALVMAGCDDGSVAAEPSKKPEDTAQSQDVGVDAGALDVSVLDVTSGSDTASESDTAPDTNTDPDSDAVSVPDTDPVSDTDSVADTASDPVSDPDTDSDSDSVPDTGSDTVSDTVSDPDTAADSVSDTAAAPDTDSDSDSVPDTVSDTVSDPDTASDTKTEWIDTANPPPAALIKPNDPLKLPLAKLEDVTKSYGISPDSSYSPCVAAGDIDNNGWQDFLLIARKGTKATIDAVLLSKSGAKHVTSTMDTTSLLPTSGCTLVELSSDGKLDLIIGGKSGAAVYEGDGKGGFADKTSKWLPFVTDFAAWTLVPADLDGDGDLDLFIGAGNTPNASEFTMDCKNFKCTNSDTDVTCVWGNKPAEKPAEQDRVLIRGSKLPLVDATKAWKVPGGGFMSGGAAIDADGDGIMDIIVGDDFGDHRLLRSTGKTFEKYDTDIGFHSYSSSMGWGIGDFNDDGLADLVLADSGPTPVFISQGKVGNKPVTYEDVGPWLGTVGVLWGLSGWSPIVADFDHDGRDDILLGGSIAYPPEMAIQFASNCAGNHGGPPPPPQGPPPQFPSLDVLFLSPSTPGKPFVAQRLYTTPIAETLQIAQVTLDLDGDGDLDVVQTRPENHGTARVRVLRNDLPKKGKSAQVVVTGKAGNLDALGTRVTAKVGGVLRTRWLNGYVAFGGTPSRFAHFGLGAAGKATDVTVYWPNGKKTTLGTLLPGDSKKATMP